MVFSFLPHRGLFFSSIKSPSLLFSGLISLNLKDSGVVLFGKFTTLAARCLFSLMV